MKDSARRFCLDSSGALTSLTGLGDERTTPALWLLPR